MPSAANEFTVWRPSGRSGFECADTELTAAWPRLFALRASNSAIGLAPPAVILDSRCGSPIFFAGFALPRHLSRAEQTQETEPEGQRAMRVVCALVLSAAAALPVIARQKADGDWRSYGRDPGAQRFSPLTQITPENVHTLK